MPPTLQLAPVPASNGVIALALDHLGQHGPSSVEPALGTEPFDGSQLPLGLGGGLGLG